MGLTIAKNPWGWSLQGIGRWLRIWGLFSRWSAEELSGPDTECLKLGPFVAAWRGRRVPGRYCLRTAPLRDRRACERRVASYVRVTSTTGENCARCKLPIGRDAKGVAVLVAARHEEPRAKGGG